MFLKLTHYGKGTPTLVNPANIKTMYPSFDKGKGNVLTQIQFIDGTHLAVREDLKEIYELLFNLTIVSKSTKIAMDMDWEVPSIDDMVSYAYHNDRDNVIKGKQNNPQRNHQNDY